MPSTELLTLPVETWVSFRDVLLSPLPKCRLDQLIKSDKLTNVSGLALLQMMCLSLQSVTWCN